MYVYYVIMYAIFAKMGAAMILTDNETKVDLLNNEAIATTITELLLDNPEQPVTIGVHGDWGAGKSSILEMIQAALESEEDVLCLKINGWRYQGFEDAKIALIEAIVTGLVSKRTLTAKACHAFEEVMKHVDMLKLAKKAGGLLFTAHTGLPSPDMLMGLLSKVQDYVTDPSKLMEHKDQLLKGVKEAKDVLKSEKEMEKEAKKNPKSVPKEIREFRAAFDKLLQEATIKRLIVLVDDLDRCLPDTAIETLEAIRLFVFTSRTAFVVAADEAMIEYAVRKHFPSLPETTGHQSYARNYLEKLIQVPFRIPMLGETETRLYVTLLLVGSQLKEEEKEFNQLLAAAREKLKRPWLGGSIDVATIKTALGEKFPKVQQELTLSEQIGSLLAKGTHGNPRQIKRFLNTLLLRQRTAKARGFGDDVRLPMLAKLMLAERFEPRFFHELAISSAASPTGICADLAALESRNSTSKLPEPAAEEDTKSPKESPPAPKPPDSTQLSVWLGTPWICDWSRIQPPLGEVDLRPYLFVAKDRKDYFGGISVLGHLSALVEQLLGPKLSVQGLLPELKKLSLQEAGQLFEAVRSRIVGGDSFDTEPNGCEGLKNLVKAHPPLQGQLLDFLESLPHDRLGPWACKGWASTLTDTATNTRFHQQLQVWATDSKNSMLQLAAGGTLKTLKGGAN